MSELEDEPRYRTRRRYKCPACAADKHEGEPCEWCGPLPNKREHDALQYFDDL